jgi:hypothetical protein
MDCFKSSSAYGRSYEGRRDREQVVKEVLVVEVALKKGAKVYGPCTGSLPPGILTY